MLGFLTNQGTKHHGLCVCLALTYTDDKIIKFFFISVVTVIDNINRAVFDEDLEILLMQLKSPCLKLPSPLHKEEQHLYLRMLKKKLLHKESQNLWLDDVVDVTNAVNAESQKVKELTDALVHLNTAVIKNDLTEFWDALSCNLLSGAAMIESSCKEVYFQIFSRGLKKRGHHICPWIVCHTDAGNTVYIDIESYTYSWVTPKDFVPYPRYLSRKDVCSLIEKTNKHHVNKYKQIIIEKTIVHLQAYCRGYLFRQMWRQRLDYFRGNQKYIIKIQAWWRKILIYRKFGTLIKMKTIESKLKRERKQNPWVWYKVQVNTLKLFLLLILSDFIPTLDKSCHSKDLYHQCRCINQDIAPLRKACTTYFYVKDMLIAFLKHVKLSIFFLKLGLLFMYKYFLIKKNPQQCVNCLGHQFSR